MSAHSAFEAALADLIAERTTGDGDRWPIVGYVLYAVTTDPETMRSEDPEWIMPEGQSSYMTRGLIEAARDELAADNVASMAYGQWEEDSDD